MIVRELIETLSKLPAEAEVVTWNRNYGETLGTLFGVGLERGRVDSDGDFRSVFGSDALSADVTEVVVIT